MKIQLGFAFCLVSFPLVAGPGEDVAEAARSAFSLMPTLKVVSEIDGNCGADEHVNKDVAYCTTSNTVFVTMDALLSPEAGYLIGHSYGHAAQVKHGVADIALAAIRARPEEEEFLRSMVERQVDCLAGLFWARAGLPPSSLKAWFTEEPFSGSHWGRNPLRIGPQVSVGLGARDGWFQIGQTATDPSGCVVEEMDAELLVKSYKD